eukprot:CAMPEP_0180429414 /NCGR_PEP_ID=MMETSP1036_2-20121128/7347_1 /TAXON_ID=632150 /ORGANISM="Azadinium spinosum, Strain 3D9" /LENGTH=96 /DNA_ID=CAMNT_0022435095 /DNA_START=160 /DNA_END=451 /DNA_ORIENTATION=-
MSGSRSMGIILVLGAIFTSPRMVFSLSFCLNKVHPEIETLQAVHMAVGGLDVAEAFPALASSTASPSAQSVAKAAKKSSLRARTGSGRDPARPSPA